MRNQEPRTDQSHCSIQTRYALICDLRIFGIYLCMLPEVVLCHCVLIISVGEGDRLLKFESGLLTEGLMITPLLWEYSCL